MNLSRASNKLSALELKIKYESYQIEVLWYRAMELDGDWMIDRHTHSSYEFHIVAQGSCKVVLDDASFIAKQGSFYMTPPGVYHEQSNLDESPFVEYSLNIEMMNLNKTNENNESELVLSVFDCSQVRPYSMKDTDIQELFEKSLKEADEEAMGYHTLVKYMTMTMLIQMARAMGKDLELEEAKVPKKLKADTQRLRLIERYIEDNLADKIRVSNIARHMHLSEKQINRIVRYHTGKSIKELVSAKKLDEAKKLLKETDYSQKEIAHLLGFTSEHYFNQFFKREEGDTPGSFKSNIGNVRKY